jgi:hypothetical protein
MWRQGDATPRRAVASSLECPAVSTYTVFYKNDVNEGVEEAARMCAALAGAIGKEGSLSIE